MADVGNTFAVVVVVILTLTTGHVCFADLEVPDPISQSARDKSIEERIGLCRSGTNLFFSNAWTDDGHACGCCLMPSDVVDTDCPGKGPFTDYVTCPRNPWNLQLITTGSSGPRCARRADGLNLCCTRSPAKKRVFDLPTDKLAAENKNAPEKYQGLSSGILRRALQRQSSIADDVISAFVDDVIEALLSDDLDNVKQAKPAFKGFM